MTEQQYWFARRFPLGDPRNSMSPVSPEGFRVAWIFVWWMVGGALAWLVLGGLAGWSVYASGLGPLTWVLAILGPVAFTGGTIYGARYSSARRETAATTAIPSPITRQDK